MNPVAALRFELSARLVNGASERAVELGATGVSVALDSPVNALLTVYAPESSFARIEAALAELAREWAPQSPFTASVVSLESDWERSWVEHLEPVQITDRLRLVPLNQRVGAWQPEASAIYLEAGLVFGFGEHPTTCMAARWLERVAPGADVLDFGTGTGVLAFVAERAGAKRVVGLDIDPASVAAAERNARRNQLTCCEFTIAPLSALKTDFAVVVANVDAATLAHCAPELRRCLRRGSQLALTGVIEEQVDAVVGAYALIGVDLRVAETVDDWVLLLGTG